MQCPDRSELAALHASGLSPYLISQRMGYSPKAVIRWLSEIGVAYSAKPMRPRHERLKWATILVSAVTGKRVMPKLYMAWDNMKKRCAGRPKYHRSYGSKGIRVCDEWLDSYATFRAWATSHGFRKGLSLDRINNDGHYVPQNCRWATPFIQSVNSRQTHMLTLKGVTKPLPIWALELNLSMTLLRYRLKAGWNHEHILTIPAGQMRPGTFRGRAATKARRLAEQTSA